MLWIQIRIDLELLSGSGIIVPDPGPVKHEEHISKKLNFKFRPVNSGLCIL